MQRREAFLANFDTWRANNGGTEAMNGLIELHSRIAAAFATATTTDYAWCSSGGLTRPALKATARIT